MHVSDLTLCLRASYFKKAQPKPPTEKQMGFFLDGARRHEALEALGDLHSEVKIYALGVTGTIDMVEGRHPIEFKSTRAQKILSEHWFRQLGYYCALTGSSKGVLVVQRLNLPREDLQKEGVSPFEFYDVEYEDSEIRSFLLEIHEGRHRLERALEEMDAESLPKTAETWVCLNCLWKKECGELTPT